MAAAMALEKKHLCLKLEPDVHAGLTLLAQAETHGDMSEWAERVLVRAIRRRIHVCTLIANRAEKLGITGNEFPDDDV